MDRDNRYRKEELKKAKNDAKDEFMGIIRDKLLELSDNEITSDLRSLIRYLFKYFITLYIKKYQQNI